MKKILLGTLGLLGAMPGWGTVEDLRKAVRNRNLEEVRNLIRLGVSATSQNVDGLAPLFVAVLLGDAEIVRVLLEQPEVDVNFRDRNGVTALFVAARNGCTEVVREILRHPGVDINAIVDDRTALQQAAWGGYTDIVRDIFQYAANHNIAVPSQESLNEWVTERRRRLTEGTREALRMFGGQTRGRPAQARSESSRVQ